MRFVFVGLKSISKRLDQPVNNQKSSENANPIEELCMELAEMLKLEIYLFRKVRIGGTGIVCVIYLKIFYAIHLYSFSQGKCEQILASNVFHYELSLGTPQLRIK